MNTVNTHFSDAYETFFGLNNKAITEFIEDNSVIDIVKMAKKGDKLATQAMYKVVERMAVAKLFREPCSFFGPSPKKSRTTSKEELENYFELVVNAIEKTIKALDVKELKAGKEKGGVEYYFRGYIQREIQKYVDSYGNDNTVSLNGGNNTEDDSGSYADKLLHNNGYESENTESNTDIIDSWNCMKQDPMFKGTNKLPIGEIFLDYLVSQDLQQTAETFDLSKNTIRYNVFPRIKDLLNKYEITQEDLAKLMKSQPHKLFSKV